MPYRHRSINPSFRIGGSLGSSGTRTNLGLNTAYVHRTSGAAVGFRIRCETNEPINELYIFLDATTGTRGNVTMRADLYNYGSPTQPGTTLLASSSVTALPGSDDRWIRFVFSTPYTPSVGDHVFAVFHNLAASPATDFPSIMTDSAASTDIAHALTRGASSTVGFSAAGTDRPELPHLVVQGTSTVYGSPCTALGTISAFNGRRGILLSEEIKKYKVSYLRLATQSSVLVAAQIFNLSTPPTGVPLFSQNMTPEEEALGIVRLDLDLSALPGSGPFVFCVSTSSTMSQAGIVLIEGYSDFPAIFDAYSDDNFVNPPVVTEVAGNWVIDRSRLYGGVFLDISDLATISGSTPQSKMRGFAY